MRELIEELGLKFMGNDAKPVSDEFISRLEDAVATRLPQDYIDFSIKTQGVCRPVKKRLVFDCMPGKKSYISVFYGDEDGGAYDVFENLESYEGRVPSFLLPIGEDPGSNLICLGIKGEQKGKVYFWSHDEEGDSDELPDGHEYVENVYLIADDFVSFLEGMANGDGSL